MGEGVSGLLFFFCYFDFPFSGFIFRHECIDLSGYSVLIFVMFDYHDGLMGPLQDKV